MDVANVYRFLAVIEQGSFAGAARQCGVTPQAIAFSITKLEAELGARLFARESGGITAPTEYATRLEPYARGLLLAERRAVEAVKALRDARSGWLRLGVGETMAGSVIAQVIADIKAERPDVEIALIEDYTDVLMKRMAAGEVDLVAGAPVTAMPPGEDVVQEILFESFDLIVARREHPLAGKARVTLADMRDFTWLVPHARRDTHQAIRAAYVEAGIAPPTSFIFSDTSTVGVALLRTQDYLLVSPPDLVTTDDDSHLVRLNAAGPTLRRVACLIHRKDQPLGALAMVARERIFAAIAGRKRPATRRLASS
ncbi:LysR family transcriptional regulator [Sphingomonas bacterium]|uniref:LysR family transcriptional regulator n=1 Tax=Sphingomonas bacterium TaxID=1895847 RepID=UPI00157680BC|nr:LysR family transcriptional regulator [Sphingomonas bacterium]